MHLSDISSLTGTAGIGRSFRYERSGRFAVDTEIEAGEVVLVPDGATRTGAGHLGDLLLALAPGAVEDGVPAARVAGTASANAFLGVFRDIEDRHATPSSTEGYRYLLGASLGFELAVGAFLDEADHARQQDHTSQHEDQGEAGLEAREAEVSEVLHEDDERADEEVYDQVQPAERARFDGQIAYLQEDGHEPEPGQQARDPEPDVGARRGVAPRHAQAQDREDDLGRHQPDDHVGQSRYPYLHFWHLEKLHGVLTVQTRSQAMSKGSSPVTKRSRSSPSYSFMMM